jgi:hypothetical protein
VVVVGGGSVVVVLVGVVELVLADVVSFAAGPTSLDRPLNTSAELEAPAMSAAVAIHAPTR